MVNIIYEVVVKEKEEDIHLKRKFKMKSELFTSIFILCCNNIFLWVILLCYTEKNKQKNE